MSTHERRERKAATTTTTTTGTLYAAIAALNERRWTSTYPSMTALHIEGITVRREEALVNGWAHQPRRGVGQGGMGQREERGDGGRDSQINLGDVEEGLPGVEAFLDEAVMVLRDAQLLEDGAQWRHKRWGAVASNHVGGGWATTSRPDHGAGVPVPWGERAMPGWRPEGRCPVQGGRTRRKGE